MTSLSHNKTIVCNVVFWGSVLLSMFPALALAYDPFVTLPGFNYSGGNVAEVVNGVFLLLLAIGAVWGVVKIALAGVKYTMSDVVTSKQQALSDIKGVLLGLAILVIPYLVLYTINPNLTNLNIFDAVGGQGDFYQPSTNAGPSGVQSGGWPAVKEGYTRPGKVCGLTQTDESLDRTPEQCASTLGCEVGDLVYSNTKNVVACETIPSVFIEKLNPLYTEADLQSAVSSCAEKNGEITNLNNFNEGFQFIPQCEIPNLNYDAS